MSLRSVMQLRDYELRSAKGRLIEGGRLELRMKAPLQGTIFLREVGSDILTFNEVIKEQIYENILSYVGRCETVIDLGANIGLASLYFAHHFPTCRVLSVEPNPGSYQMLVTNLRGLIKKGRCKTLQAAVWGSETTLVPGPLDELEHFSAFATREGIGAPPHSIEMQGLPMPTIVAHSGFERIDILKVDIEGAEIELFKGDLGWLTKVRSIAIEFHENSREVCAFDDVMQHYGFGVIDSGSHTVLAVKDE